MQRFVDALGWIGGAVTVYWTLGLGGFVALWMASRVLRLFGRA